MIEEREVEGMSQRKALTSAARAMSLLLLVAVILGVALSDRYAEEQRTSVEVPQRLDDGLTQVADTPTSATDGAGAPGNPHEVPPESSSWTTLATSAIPSREADRAAWRTVGSWTGGYGTKETERFAIEGSDWRISWRTTGASGRVCALGIYVYDVSGAFVTLAALRQGVDSDVSYVHAQPGQFYLSVISCLADWEIAVEDCF